jgi:hypothetical protein
MLNWFPIITTPERFAFQVQVLRRIADIEREFRSLKTAEVIPLIRAAPISPELFWAAVA